MRNLVCKSQRRWLVALFMVCNLAWLSACEQQAQKPNVVGNDVSFELPSVLASVDIPSHLISTVYIKEEKADGSFGPEIKIPLRTTVRNNTTVTAEGSTSAFEMDKKYKLQLEVTYDRNTSQDPTQTDIVKIFRSEDIKIDIQLGLDGKTIEGTAQLTAADFAKHKLFADDDLDGYSNLEEIDSSLGGNKTDIRDAFKFPGNGTTINASKNLSFIVCPMLNDPTINDIKTKLGISNPSYVKDADYRDCSNNGANDFTWYDSAADTFNLIMATDFGFNDITMEHDQSLFKSNIISFPNWSSTRTFRHTGMINSNATFYNILDQNCSSVVPADPTRKIQWKCDRVKWAQPDTVNWQQAVNAMSFVSEYTRTAEQTAYLPTWMKLDANIDEKTGSSDISISWEDIYVDANTAANLNYVKAPRTINIALIRANNIVDATIDSYDKNGGVAEPAFTGKQLGSVGRTTLASGKVGAQNSPFNFTLDSTGIGTLSFVDKTARGGVMYYYVIETTAIDTNDVTHINTTAPIGISTIAATQYIEGNDTNASFPTSDNVQDVEGASEHIITLGEPVAYGTVLKAYYIFEDETELSKVDRATFKTNCEAKSPTPYDLCQIITMDRSPYTFSVPFSSTGLQTLVLLEKTDRYGRSAGHQIKRLNH